MKLCYKFIFYVIILYIFCKRIKILSADIRVNYMKNKKKLIIIIIAVLLVALCIAAAVYFLVIKGDKEPTLKETVDSRISAYETDLRDSLASMTDQKSVVKYLTSWAEHKGIDVKSDKNNNVIFRIDSTEGFESQPPVVILCSYDYSCMESYINSMVTALTVAKNDSPHGAYNIIFLSQEKGDMSAVENLSTQYFPDGAKVFYLGNSPSSRIADITGGYERYSISRVLNQTSPTYNKAYTITISGLPAQSFGSKSASEPNPIKTLGNLLANFKSTSILFDLASFTGGTDVNLTPSQASITILVSEDASAKLEKKLDSAIEKFYDRYLDKYPDVQYTYEVVETPSKVISSEDTESIISLLYTALSGTGYKDDSGEIASLTNIGFLSTTGGSFVMEVAAASYDADLLTEIAETYQTTSFLAGVEYSLKAQYAPYVVGGDFSVASEDASSEEASDEDSNEILRNNSELETAFREAYTSYQSVKLDSLNIPDFTPCETISKKNSKMTMLVIGVTDRTKDNFAGGLITFLGMKAEE